MCGIGSCDITTETIYMTDDRLPNPYLVLFSLMPEFSSSRLSRLYFQKIQASLLKVCVVQVIH